MTEQGRQFTHSLTRVSELLRWSVTRNLVSILGIWTGTMIIIILLFEYTPIISSGRDRMVVGFSTCHCLLAL